MLPFSDEQKAIYDAEMQSLRERMAWRKKVMALPTKRQRDKDIDRLRETVEKSRWLPVPSLTGQRAFSRPDDRWLLRGRCSRARTSHVGRSASV